jgi:peptidyl-prolyl cis-trans isomerase SurA
MKRFVSLFTLLFLLVSAALAQKDVLISINKNKFTKDEYEKIYVKNNTQLSDENEIKSPEEYLDLFINYKLKVLEAQKMGLDTLESFRKELAGYRDELAKPYLTDIEINDSTLKDTYYRTTHLVKASHILLEIPGNTSPNDTVKIYNRLLEIRNQFIKGEKSFEELAFEYSEDPSAKHNRGDLGYFKAFSMITLFENVAYNTPVGEVSMPFMTPYGFHIVYVTDVIKLEGEVKVAHIMKMYKNRNHPTEEEDLLFKHQLDSLHVLLQNGADFGKLARDNSDDRNSIRNNGEMGFISKTFNIPEFVDVAYSLKADGDFTSPVKTPFGWHIIKRTGYKPVPTFEEARADLIEKVRKDPLRSSHSKERYYSRIKEELNMVTYDENIAAFKKYINDLYEDTIFNEVFPDDILALKLHQIKDETYTVKDFYNNVQKLNVSKSKIRKSIFFPHLAKFDEIIITEYMNKNLESLHPEFAQIVREYHDGMLLFSIMEKKVWNKAVEDSIGLENYYHANRDQYIWDEHFKGLWIRCYNQAAVDSCKYLLEQGITDPEELEARINVDSKSNIRVSAGKWEKGTNKRIDYLVFGGEKPERFNDDFEFVEGKLQPAGAPKSLEEARGIYISDYQQELEEQWVKELRSKAKIAVNKKLLKQIQSLKK